MLPAHAFPSQEWQAGGRSPGETPCSHVVIAAGTRTAGEDDQAQLCGCSSYYYGTSTFPQALEGKQSNPIRTCPQIAKHSYLVKRTRSVSNWSFLLC